MHPLLQQLLGLIDEMSPVMMDHGDINDRPYEDADGDLTSTADEPESAAPEEPEGAPSAAAMSLIGRPYGK